MTFPRPRSWFAIGLCLVWVVCVSVVVASTYNTPTINGMIQISESDWEADELAGEDPPDDSRYGEADINNLYVTWDASNLYFAYNASGPGGFGNGYVLFMDKDAQLDSLTGAQDFTAANFYPRKITLSTMGADVVMGGWNFMGFDIRDCVDPQNTATIPGAIAVSNPGLYHVESFVSWDALYGVGAGQVPPGTKLRFIICCVGGDNSGAYDASPSSSNDADGDGIPDENDQDVVWNDYTDLNQFYEIPVDANLDGIPDEGYPPGGSISGTVTLSNPSDNSTVVTIKVYDATTANLVTSVETDPGAGDYTIYALEDGMYDLKAAGFSYLDSVYVGVEIVDEADVTGIDFYLREVSGKIIGDISIADGPGDSITVTAYHAGTTNIAGDGAKKIAPPGGDFVIAAVMDGTFDVYFEADGYITLIDPATVTEGDTAYLYDEEIYAVRATRLLFTDGTGEGREVRAVGTTISIAEDSLYFFADVNLELLDDLGNRDLYDLNGVTDSIVLDATLLDPAYPPVGEIRFADRSEDFFVSSTLDSNLFYQGLALFSVSGTEVEVIRLEASRSSLVSDHIQVDILPPEPDFVELIADSSQVTAGSPGAMITGQLLDVSGNVVEEADVEVQMFIPSGGGKVSPSIVYTDPEGGFQSSFSSTSAGTTLVTALVGSEGSYLEADTLGFVIRPAKESTVSLSASYNLDRTATVSAGVLDQYGNSVKKAGVSVELSVEPPGLIDSVNPETIVTDTLGQATALMTPSQTANGIAEISGASDLEVTSAFLFVSTGIAAIDEVAPESDEAHNSDPGADLTLLLAKNDADSLYVIVPFSSDWADLHMMLLIESQGDQAGASTDPFTFPIYYGHNYLPDYVFTYKYAADDYGDIRRWTGSGWEFWDLESGMWITDESASTKNARPWVTKESDQVIFQVPLVLVEGAYGDTIRVEVYISQDFESSEKRAAYDTSPPDATHDMRPATGEWWENATIPNTLSQYGTYVLQEPRIAPTISDAFADPDSIAAGNDVTFHADLADAGGGIGQVSIDLSGLGLSRYQTLYDDGTNGDNTAGDGSYSYSATAPLAALGGSYTLYVSAGDSTNLSITEAPLSLFIEAPELPDPIRVAADSIGDDHGPNTPGEEGLYYSYPTNQVFFEGSFDLEKIEIFALDDQIVFRVKMGQLASPDEMSGAADWNAIYPKEENCTNPYRADLNLQKIDIYIDSEPGGAESGLTNRYADIAKCDAWEYAIAAEGWWKGVIHSNGQNTRGGWSLFKLDEHISLCNSYVEDFMDITVAKSVLGDPTEEDIRNWDLIVCLSGHDGDSNDENFGAIRWVNPGTPEWQFGGGRTGEDNRERDSNVIDMLAMAGEGKEPGRSQEELMNYDSSEARARFEAGKTAVVLEATLCEDTTPPNIADLSEESGAVQWASILGAPIVVGTKITDDLSGISEAIMYWKGLGEASYHEATMGRWNKGFWVGDIDYDQLSDVANVIDEYVYFQVQFAVEDSAGNYIESREFVVELDEPVWNRRQVIDIQQHADSTISDSIIIAKVPDYFSDGSILELSSRTFTDVDGHINIYLDVEDQGSIDLDNLPGGVRFEGVARDFTVWDVGEEPFVSSDDIFYDALNPPGFINLHRPGYLPSISDGRELVVYRYDDDAERWILVGGRHRQNGNMVRAIMDHAGLYGLFSQDIGIESDRILSGVVFSPNPFSPNGDGMYDEVNISFSLAKEADVTLEIYDMAGMLVKRLFWQKAFGKTGRVSGFTWDGKDDEGNAVPYGIYIVRFEARDNVANRSERANAAVAVIR